MRTESTSRQPRYAILARRAGVGKFLAALVLASASPAAAEQTRSLAISLGVFNVSKDETSLEGGVEYRIPTGGWGLTAVGGLSGTEEGSIYVLAGLRREFRLGEGWWVTPAFGIALYEDGGGKDLGGPVEFRSAIEVAYEWPKRYRLALVFYHLSNAGLDEQNPGSNSLVLTYSFPL